MCLPDIPRSGWILYLYIPGLGRSMQEVFKALPYVVTIIVLVFTSFRKKKEHQPPAAIKTRTGTDIFTDRKPSSEEDNPNTPISEVIKI